MSGQRSATAAISLQHTPWNDSRRHIPWGLTPQQLATAAFSTTRPLLNDSTTQALTCCSIPPNPYAVIPLPSSPLITHYSLPLSFQLSAFSYQLLRVTYPHRSLPFIPHPSPITFELSAMSYS
jgi:hypothetical protein